MDAIGGIRLLAASLMAVLGIIYLIFAVLFGSLLETMEIAPALMASAGVVYLVVAIGLFANKRLFNYLGGDRSFSMGIHGNNPLHGKARPNRVSFHSDRDHSYSVLFLPHTPQEIRIDGN
jgi:hypothetical protein